MNQRISWNNFIPELLDHFKQSFYAGALFLIIPGILYLIITWDPIIPIHSEDESPITLGIILVFGLYWIGLYFWYRGRERKRKLNELIDLVLDEEELKYYLKIAKEKRKSATEEGEYRSTWFGIH